MFARLGSGFVARLSTLTCTAYSGTVGTVSASRQVYKYAFKVDCSRPVRFRRERRELLWRTVKLPPSTTGVPWAIFITPKLAFHGPFVKVVCARGGAIGRCFTFTVGDDPWMIGNTNRLKATDLVLLGHFVLLNLKLLLDYWHGAINTPEALSRIRRINAREAPSRPELATGESTPPQAKAS